MLSTFHFIYCICIDVYVCTVYAGGGRGRGGAETPPAWPVLWRAGQPAGSTLLPCRVVNSLFRSSLFCSSLFRSCRSFKKSDGTKLSPFYAQNKRANHYKRRHSLPSLIKKEERERFTLVHLKRPTIAICSLKRANPTFALKKLEPR